MEHQSKWQQWKEIWANKRYRALLIFGFYLVFLSFLVILIRTTDSSTSSLQEDTSHKNSNQVENYEYEYVIEKEETYRITAEHYDSKELVHDVTSNATYVIEKGQFFEVIQNKMIPCSDKIYGLHLLKLNQNNIQTLLEKCNLTYTKTYQDNRVVKNYEITVKNFYNWYDGTFSNNTEIIPIIVEETNDFITQISLDLTHFDHSKRTITYFHYNQLTGLELNYEKD